VPWAFHLHEATYLFAIAHNNVIDLISILAKAPQTIIDAILVSDIQETPLWLSEQARVILDCISLSRSVYDTKHFLEMSLQQLLREICSQHHHSTNNS
jgi:hypothetical protein